MKMENMTKKEIELLAERDMLNMKDVGEDWAREYIIRNCPGMVKILTRGKNKGRSTILWSGNVTLKELIGDGNPRSWMDTACGCYFVHYLDWQSGSMRMGKAISFTRHNDGTITIRVKTPEDFQIYGEKEEEIEGLPIKAKRKYKKRKTGNATHVNINNILWALHPHKNQRVHGGIEKRLLILRGRVLKPRTKSWANKSKGKKGKRETAQQRL